MDAHSEKELITAIFNDDVEKYDALLQNAPVLNNGLLMRIILSTSNHYFFHAALNHSSINPFFNDYSLIREIISHNLPTEYLTIILEHPSNHLTSEDYHALITSSGHSQEKQDLLQVYLNKQ